MGRSLAVLIAATILSGCASGPFEWKYGHDKIVPGQFGIVGSQGSVLTWPSHAVGAIVYPGTSAACIQSAQSAKARNSAGTGGLTFKSPEKSEIDLHLAQAISEAIMTIQDKNDVATFADVSLFQICTIAANNKLTSDQTVSLVKIVMQTSLDIARARPTVVRNTTTVNPPDPKAPEKAAIAAGGTVEKKQEVIAVPEAKK